jgi:GTP 3',8-cyclase
MSIPISPTDQPGKGTLVDGFFRTVSYLRVSVTDRCDLRCVYCMSLNMTFLPKKDLLTLEELDRICSAFIARGVRKLRLTGGEPLMRRGFLDLVRSLSRHLKSEDLQELTLTTNGTQLSKYAADLAAFGVRRINVSLDTLDSDLFMKITRGGDIALVREGIAAARVAGLKVKINTVALRDLNEASLESLIEWSHARGIDITLIETMPLGDTGEDRTDQYVPLSRVRSQFGSLDDHLPIHPLARHVRFTLRSRYRPPAPACPFGANKRHRLASSDHRRRHHGARTVGLERRFDGHRTHPGDQDGTRWRASGPIFVLPWRLLA